MVLPVLFLLLGWIIGVIINHAANGLPLKMSFWRTPFCKRRLNFMGQEAVSIAQKGTEGDAAEAPTWCLTPRPLLGWSGLLAYFTGHQRCPSCGKSMGLRAPVVELVTPILFLLIYIRFGFSVYLFFALGYAAILVLLTVTDLEHRLIQNKVILPAILFAVAGSFFAPDFGWRQAVFGGALGFIIFYLFALLARGGFGSGDVTLSAFLGLITGFPNVVIVLVYGILLGGLVSVVLLLTKKATLKTFIPYGPFLMLSGMAIFLWGNSLSAWIWR